MKGYGKGVEGSKGRRADGKGKRRVGPLLLYIDAPLMLNTNFCEY